jgi:hypothetical protein
VNIAYIFKYLTESRYYKLEDFRLIRLIIFLIFLLVLNVNLFAQNSLVQIGGCITDPDAKNLQDKWKKYHELSVKRTKINLTKLVEEIRMDQETMRLLQSVSEVEMLVKYLDDLENKYLIKAFVDLQFNDLIASDSFIDKLLKNEIDQEIKNSKLSFKNDPHFYEILDKIRNEVKRSEIQDALSLFKTYDLGVLQKEYRKSAKYALQLVRSRGATLAEVRRWKTDPPYLRNIPLPKVQIGPFAEVYRTLLKKSISSFVLNRKVSYAEAKKLFPSIKKDEVELINNITPPVEKNAFDENIIDGRNLEIAAIDGVARTLWGEASSCEAYGLSQFEAIGRIIADRSIAVCRAIKEQNELNQKQDEVREKNWTTFLSNWAGIKRPAPGMQNKPYAKLKGLSDFGRKEKMEIPCAAQVVSKKNQFSVWNSYAIKKYHTGQFHKNIPDAIFEIQGPQAENDDKALVRILCPGFQTEDQKKIWKKAVELSTMIVKEPAKIKQKIQWSTEQQEILFYTHDANLPFAKEIKKVKLSVDGKKVELKKKGSGACGKFRLFYPKVKGSY